MGWAIRDLIPSRGKIYVCPPKRPNRLRGHPVFYSVGTGGSFFGSKAGEAHRLPPSGAEVNLFKPTGYVMHPQFNIQQLYALSTLYLCVLYLSENKQRLVPLTA